MAGYTRQSVASIINGANITAPPLNAEFNQLLAAFSVLQDMDIQVDQRCSKDSFSYFSKWLSTTC